MADTRLPLTILGGFLGAGKTTWLRHQLRHGMQAHVLVNEAAGVAVDDALLSDARGMTLLAGGCACCEGRGALLAALRGLADRRSRGEGVADLVLETSGLADPAGVLAAIAGDPVLVHHIRAVGVTVLVDGLSDLSRMAPLAVAQMRAADRLVVTKVDAVPVAVVARVVATLRVINPLAEVSAAVAGVAVALPQGVGEPFAVQMAEEHALNAMTLALPPEADWASVSLWLSGVLHTHGEAIVRVKGVVRTPAGRLLIQSVRRQVQAPEVLPEGVGLDDALAVIGYLPEAGVLERSLARFLA